MVSPPEFHYRDATLTLPLVTINHGEQITDRAVIRHNNTTQYYPNQSMSNVNPVETGKVSVTVQSEYYRAWGEYFEERTDGTVDYPDSQPNTVRLNLTVPSDGQTVDGAIVSGGSGTAIELKAKTGVDSYNSKISDYASSSPGNNGDIYTAGEVDFKNDAILNGSLVIEDELTMKSDSEIRGDLTHGGDIPSDADSNHVVGTVGPGADVPDPKPVDGEIERKINTFETTNDNSTHSGNLTALDNGDPCTPCNLTAGQYYVEDFTADGTVYLKPDGGTVQIAVNNDFTVKNSGTVEVIGDGRVEFYVEDEGELENSAKVTNKGDNAPQFWLYMKSDESYTAKKGDLTGVVYGPKNASRGTTGVKINMKQDSQTYGALVGEIENIDNNADIHYDTALSSTSAVDTGESTVPTLTYLHISTNEINITSK